MPMMAMTTRSSTSVKAAAHAVAVIVLRCGGCELRHGIMSKKCDGRPHALRHSGHDRIEPISSLLCPSCRRWWVITLVRESNRR